MSWISNIFSGNKATDAERGASYPTRGRVAPPQQPDMYQYAQPPAYGQPPMYQPQYQQPYAYQAPQLVEIPRPEAVRAQPQQQEAKVDINKEVRGAVEQIRKVQREWRIDDMRWRAQAKEYLAQDRREEAEDLLDSLTDSKLFQRQLDRNIISVQKAARNARTSEAIFGVYRLIDKVVTAATKGEKVDIQDISDRQLEQQQQIVDMMETQQVMGRMAVDNDGRQASAERTRVRNAIIQDLHNDMTGSLPAPAVTQLQAPAQAQPEKQALLSALL